MVVNVAVPVVHTPDGVVVLSRSRLRLWKRERSRAVRFTRVATLDRDTPQAIARDVARQCADVMWLHYADVVRPRGAEVRVRFRYE
jgi:hypothetical protein